MKILQVLAMVGLLSFGCVMIDAMDQQKSPDITIRVWENFKSFRERKFGPDLYGSECTPHHEDFDFSDAQTVKKIGAIENLHQALKNHDRKEPTILESLYKNSKKIDSYELNLEVQVTPPTIKACLNITGSPDTNVEDIQVYHQLIGKNLKRAFEVMEFSGDIE